MNAIVSLCVVPKIDLTRLGFTRRQRSWQGIKSEESSRLFEWGAHLTLESRRAPPSRRISVAIELSHYGENWDCLVVKGDGLDMYWDEVRGCEVDWGGSSLEGMLRVLAANVERWALEFDIDDRIEEQFVGGVDDAIVIMRRCLQMEPLPRGFVVSGSHSDR